MSSTTRIRDHLFALASEPPELIDVTGFSNEPEFLPGMSGLNQAVSQATAYYVHGTLTFDEFNSTLDAIFAAQVADEEGTA